MNKRQSTITQNHKSARVLITCTFITFTLLFRASIYAETVNTEAIKSSSVQSPIRIHLPREIKIESQNLSLGQIAIVRGEESLAAKAGEIALGRFSMPGQEIVVDRSVILGRLASNGIDASKVTLTGAEKITVKQQLRVIRGSEFVETAGSFLKKNPPADSICQTESVRIPKDLFVPEMSKNIKLVPCLVGGGSKNSTRIQVAVFADGKRVGTREVTLRLKYNCRRAVTLVELAAGQALSPENIKIEEVASNYPEPLNWSEPYGLVTRRRIAANTVIGRGMVSTVKSQVLLERNKTVLIRFERPGLLITAVGKTMQRGKAGEYIKVRNVDSQRVILAKVKEDGTVEPVF
ncbi:MAG: flagellar basal body P-ring formation chaperone FlgA [Planctomycetota bacterium]|jgi:flagella basal body P-ring formation protein FlgA